MSSGVCLSNLPTLSAAVGTPIPENTRTRILNSFEKLFSEMEKLMAPKYFKYPEEEEEKKKKETVALEIAT